MSQKENRKDSIPSTKSLTTAIYAWKRWKELEMPLSEHLKLVINPPDCELRARNAVLQACKSTTVSVYDSN